MPEEQGRKERELGLHQRLTAAEEEKRRSAAVRIIARTGAKALLDDFEHRREARKQK